MNKETEDKCQELILKYFRYKQESKKIKVRNELYELMMDDMLYWVKSIVVKWGRFEEEDEMLSLSFDIFLFCLKHYKEHSSVISHFYKYTKYYLMNRYAQQDKVRIPMEELKETLTLIEDPLSQTFLCLLEIQEIRSQMPEEYRIVWDDALMSLHPQPKSRLQSKDHSLSQSNYFALKKAFKVILNHIFKGVK